MRVPEVRVMGFWNVTAADLEQGDEVRVIGEVYVTVLDADRIGGHVKARMKGKNGRPFYETFRADEKLTVRR